jgi:DNA-binding LytR/AlgR family response regulator
MYRILFYKNTKESETSDSDNTQLPITWFDGSYNKNVIPFPILFNKKRLLSSFSKEIILEKAQRYIELNINQLLRIESTTQGSTLFLENNAFWTTKKVIENFESDLVHHSFFRVNKNTLINLHHLKSFITCDAVITLSNMEAIPVDAKKKEHLL